MTLQVPQEPRLSSAAAFAAAGFEPYERLGATHRNQTERPSSIRLFYTSLGLGCQND